MLESAPDSSPAARIKNTGARAKWLLRFFFGVALIGVLWKWQGAGSRAALEKISPALLLGVVLCYLATQVLSAAKWRLLLNAGLRAREITSDNISPDTTPQLSLVECARFYLVGMFWNLWMPTSVGGDAMRAYLAGRRCRDYALAATSIFVERLTGFLALLFIGAVGLTWQIAQQIIAPEAGTSNTLAPALSTLLAGLGITFAFFLLFFLTRRSLRRTEFNDSDVPQNFRQKLMRLLFEAQRALELYLQPQTRGALWGALAMSLLFQSLQVLLNFALARAVGLELSMGNLAWIVPSLSIASMLPLGIGGLGVREAAALGLVRGVLPNAAPGTIIAWSLCWQATVWLAALPGGVLHFLKREENYESKYGERTL